MSQHSLYHFLLGLGHNPWRGALVQVPFKIQRVAQDAPMLMVTQFFPLLYACPRTFWIVLLGFEHCIVGIRTMHQKPNRFWRCQLHGRRLLFFNRGIVSRKFSYHYISASASSAKFVCLKGIKCISALIENKTGTVPSYPHCMLAYHQVHQHRSLAITAPPLLAVAVWMPVQLPKSHQHQDADWPPVGFCQQGRAGMGQGGARSQTLASSH